MSKFKVSLKLQGFELSVEGDRSEVPLLTQAIGSQMAGLLGPAAAIVNGRVVDVEVSNDTAVARKPAKPSRSRGPKGEAPQKLIEDLISDGFFASARSASDVQTALAKKGFNYDAGALSTPLTRLTRKQELTRDRDGDSPYSYIKSNGSA